MSETPIIVELQRLASDSETPVSDLLRKALIVATKLNLQEFRDWIQNELNGYKGKDRPAYRKLQGRLTAVTQWGERAITFNDLELDRMVSTAPIDAGIAEVEQLAQATKPLHVVLTGGQIQSILNAFPHEPDFIPRLIVSPAGMRGIIDAVRNNVLDWALRLESEGILGDGMSFSEDEKKKAAGHTIHIGGDFHGVVGDVRGRNVQIGDYGSIHEQLKQAGVSQADRNELENIMDELKTAKAEEKPGLIQRGMNWLGKNAETIGAVTTAAIRTYLAAHGVG